MQIRFASGDSRLASAPRPFDAHHHIWRLKDLAWLSGPQVPRIFGPYESICRDYSIDEFRADTAGCDVVKSVYVQTNWPAGQSYDEATY